MANTSISGLTGGAAVAAGDLFPDVQTVGVGPVKVTAAQLKTFMSASPTLVAPVVITEAVGSSALTLNGATQTSSFPVLSATQRWNNAATTFTAWKLNVTDTASAAGSLLLDLQVGAVSKVSVDKYGNLVLGSSATVLPGAPGSTVAAINADLNIWNDVYMNDANSRLNLRSAMTLGWQSGAAATTGAPDSAFSRISAGIIGVGTGAQGSTAGQLSMAVSRVVPQATLPGTPTAGMIVAVNTATAPTPGVVLALGGAAYALAWYNNAQWTVIGN